MDGDQAETAEAAVIRAMEQAHALLLNANLTRESSIVLTKLEEVMMWCNKDRTNKGELKPNPTHV